MAPGTYDEFRDDVQAELTEPGAVTKAELRELLRKHPPTDTVPARGVWDGDVFDPSVWS